MPSCWGRGSEQAPPRTSSRRNQTEGLDAQTPLARRGSGCRRSCSGSVRIRTTTKVTRSAGVTVGQHAAGRLPRRGGTGAPDACRPQGQDRPLSSAEEQDVNGFNTNLSCCNQLAGGFLVPQRIACMARSSRTTRACGSRTSHDVGVCDPRDAGPTRIKPNANWYWGGKKIPVTYKDFVYTLQQIDNPRNDSPAGPATAPDHRLHTPTRATSRSRSSGRATNCTTDFPCGAYANWQSIFASGLYPSAALAGQDFNKIWTNCICGSDGQPVSNGPFYLTNYTKGQGTTLKTNPFWAGKSPAWTRSTSRSSRTRTPRSRRCAAARSTRSTDVRLQPHPAQGSLRDHVQPDPGLLHGAPRHSSARRDTR